MPASVLVMTAYRADTIVACATPPGRGAISIVRWSGADALAVAARIFRPRRGGPCEPWRLCIGTVLARDGGTAIDEALGVYFPKGHSFTGEDSYELHCHGSPLVVEQVVAAAIAAGARAAERGEFSRRAVLNGRLDLLQAEAVADLIDARMAAGARAAWAQLQGALSGELAELRRQLVSVLARIEADVDFSEDELPDPDLDLREAAITAVSGRIGAMLDGYAAARRQREGLRIVFGGRPNAGKSSLVNRLLGTARMIVSDEPGTTRDVVDETVELAGIAFVLTDTAGLREVGGAAENEAVSRARATAEEADLRVLVIDASKAPTDEDEAAWESLAGADTIVAWNKSDLEGHIPARLRDRLAGVCDASLATSARSGAGCEALSAAIVGAAKSKLAGEIGGISRLRHRACLERAQAPLLRAQQLAREEGAAELAAIELRSAIAELASIASPLDNEEVLDRIFSEFCIGK